MALRRDAAQPRALIVLADEKSVAPVRSGAGSEWLWAPLSLVTAIDGRDPGSGTAPARLLTGAAVRLLGSFALFVLFVTDTNQMADGQPELTFLAWPLAASHIGAVVLTWRFPLTGWRVSFLATALTALVTTAESGVPWEPAALVAHLVALLLFAISADLPLVGAALLADACVFVTGSLRFGAQLDAVVAGPVALLLVAGLGAALGAQRRTAQELDASRRDAAADEARHAVLEERARIARELHDVVAHHLSRIAVRAVSAPVRVAGAGPEVTDELQEIASDARDALTDMRRLLGVLRTDDGSPLAPTPGLQDVQDLVTAARRAGAEVALSVTGDAADPVSPDVGLAGYRIVQEALSNAARRGPATLVDVAVHRSPDEVRIRVRNEPCAGREQGPATGGRETKHLGHGLAGMRERAEAAGGTVHAGSDPDGGWTVRATLPVAVDGNPDRWEASA